MTDFRTQAAVERAIASAKPRTASVTQLANAAISAYREATPVLDPIVAAQAAADALGERLAGIAWPCASDGDDSLPFVERDDEVNAYVDDDQAAQTLAHLLGGGARVMWAERYDHHGALQPFVYAPGVCVRSTPCASPGAPLSVFADSLAARLEPGCGDARELVEREGGLLDHATRARLVELVEARRA